MVIFGATGDLTSRKLMPALYNLLSYKTLPERFFVVGFARRPVSHEEFRSLMKEAILRHMKGKKIDMEALNKLLQNLYYQQGLFEEKEPYEKLINLLSSFDKEIGACITRFFYLAAPPLNYSTILNKLASTRLSEGCGQGRSKWTRVLIEKPFGKDSDTAKKLEEQLTHTFEERQIYRIDHYLAKENIQNILAFRFANAMFEPLWNKDCIDHVQIVLAENSGIGNRGKFYEGVGALKDVVQNHLMAMLAYIAMDEPGSMSVDSIRAERVKVLQSIKKMTKEYIISNIIRGQYGKGLINERKVEGYREEKNIAPDSLTDTYIAMKLYLDNKRWDGVPFYLRTGKRMPFSAARISIQFKKPTHKFFESIHEHKEHWHDNVLTFRIQPREGISLQMLAKKPGLGFSLQNVKMDFSYESSFGHKLFDSYERLLIDSIRGDQTLFATNSGFNATWKVVTDIEKVWAQLPLPKFPNYQAGSWGPKEAEELISRDGRHWLLH